MADKPKPLSAASPDAGDTAMLRGEWIERYGGQELLDREGFEVVPCTNCGDSICHGWRVVPARFGGRTTTTENPMSERIDHIETIRTALERLAEELQLMRAKHTPHSPGEDYDPPTNTAEADARLALASLTALQEERERIEYRCLWEERMAGPRGHYWVAFSGRVGDFAARLNEYRARLADPKYREVHIEARVSSMEPWPRPWDAIGEPAPDTPQSQSPSVFCPTCGEPTPWMPPVPSELLHPAQQLKVCPHCAAGVPMSSQPGVHWTGSIVGLPCEACRVSCSPSDPAAVKDLIDGGYYRLVPEGKACECPARKALDEMLRLTELLSPPDTHIGACGPESGCDGACAELAAIAGAVSRGSAALAAPCPRAGLRQELEVAASTIEVLKSDLAREREAWTDEDGTTWTRPTAWAYQQACRTLRKSEAERDSLRAELQQEKQGRLHDILAEQAINAELRGELASSKARSISAIGRELMVKAELAERIADLEQAVRLGVAHMEDALAAKAELAASQERERVLREILSSLRNEVNGVFGLAPIAILDAVGGTNVARIELRLEQAASALATPEGTPNEQ